MKRKYQIVVSDPAWSFSDLLHHSDVKRGAAAQYDTLSIDDIKALPVSDLSDPNGSILALWVPSALLEEGIAVMKAWQFNLKQTWIWVKVKKDPLAELKEQIAVGKAISLEDVLSFGLGRIARNCHELCLIGTRGKIYDKLKNKSQRTVFFYQNEKHSKKPEILQDRLEVMFDGDGINKLELFARRQRKNWICVGNEAPMTYGEDVRVSLNKLLNA